MSVGFPEVSLDQAFTSSTHRLADTTISDEKELELWNLLSLKKI